jgi:ABC-2 type transport system permease protein
VQRASAPGVFMAVLWRDLFVTGRELRVFLAQVILQPLFILFVFGKVPSSLGVAVEKMVFAAMRALVAAVFMFPIGVLILGSVPWRSAGAPEFVVVLILGTLVPPSRISLTFSLVLAPLLFTGCSQYPWPTLDTLRWFQVVTAFNPLTYVSEGMRGALVPAVPHIRPWICVAALLLSLALFSAIGIWGFTRRAID